MPTQEYRVCLPPRQIRQANILKDIRDLLFLWSFPPGQKSEVILGVCDAGFKELRSIDPGYLARFFQNLCGPDARINIISHAEMKGAVKCQ